MDLVVALAIVGLAYVLGLVVHPLLWVIAVAPALWLVGTHDRRVNLKRLRRPPVGG